MALEMDAAQLRAFQDLQELPEVEVESEEWDRAEDILSGKEVLEISHEGGEMQSLAQMHDGCTNE